MNVVCVWPLVSLGGGTSRNEPDEMRALLASAVGLALCSGDFFVFCSGFSVGFAALGLVSVYPPHTVLWLLGAAAFLQQASGRSAQVGGRNLPEARLGC